ncbi:MAG: hypothetical protein WCP39_01635 [Chlamydiota bacterium]
MNNNTSCDTSVLINFLKIKRIDLLQNCSHFFFITDHVVDEITTYYPNQQALLKSALDQKILTKVSVNSSEELKIFEELSKSGQLGAGECAAIAFAVHQNYYLTIDDNQAIKKASFLLLPNRILRTQDLILLMIQENLLNIDEADHMIQIWAKEHRFKLKFNSFNELAHCCSSKT